MLKMRLGEANQKFNDLNSLEAEVAGLLRLFHLVKFQKAGKGAEDVGMALPLINGRPVNQHHFAV